MRESWKIIENYPDYAVSNCGRVKNISSGHILKLFENHQGYLRVGLYRDGQNLKSFTVHRLVLTAFMGPCPEGKECNHKDGVKTNNRVNNLEWISHAENNLHSHRVLGNKGPCGEQNGGAKLTENQVREIRDLSGWYPQYKIAEMFSITCSTVYDIISRKSWKHVI